MVVVHYAAVEQLYDLLREPTSVEHATAALNAYYVSDRSEAEIEDFRALRGHPARLRKEIVPVMNYVTRTGFKGKVSFGLNNQFPDAQLHSVDGTILGVEVTLAEGRQSYAIGDKLNKDGWASGHKNVSESAPNQAFNAAFQGDRVMMSSDKRLKVLGKHIGDALHKKSGTANPEVLLLVEGGIDALPHRTDELKASLLEGHPTTGYAATYVVGERGGHGFYLHGPETTGACIE